MKLTKGFSLKAQLYLLITCLVTFSFFASTIININNMQVYLDEQLASHAQDAAHNLGLSISPYMDEENLVIAKTMTNAIFDSGYYQYIKFTDLNGELKFSRQNQTSTINVPNWFTQLFTLTPPEMISEVSNGWVIAGKLAVQSNVGAANFTLWQHSQKVLWLSLFQLIGALLLGYLILKAVLTPLRKIETQANAVASKQYNINPDVPFTTELRAVVNALNKMVSNIKQSFDEQTKHAESLSKQVYIDSHTELPNRRALLQKFDSLKVEAAETGTYLYLNLISMSSLQEINDTQGYSAGDSYILWAANLFKTQVTPFDESTLYRISGSEFVILSLLSSEQASKLDNLLNEAISVASNDHYPQDFAKQIMTMVQLDETFPETIQRCDTNIATQEYFLKPNNPICESSQQSHSRLQWLAILKQFIEHNEGGLEKSATSHFNELDNIFDLMLQPIIDNEQQLLYVETFVRFKLGDELFSTPDVFAMAERLGLSVELEKAVVSFIFNKLLKVKQTKVAINISNNVIHDESFTAWLMENYQQQRSELPEIILEINESAAIAAITSTKRFITAAKAAGLEITLERFGANLSTFSYIRNLDIDYIKLDGSYIRDLNQADTRFFVQTITQICHGIGIKIIAPHVENLSISTHCLQMNIDGLQGNGLYPVANFNTIISSKNDALHTILLINKFNPSPQIKEK
ncbi:EAL domain-containing protein [Shewanella olleyana]|uniref:bifunctional diguanylate cyclase/phosphodiesterase n=1 Tax=Shewanella olleyana TaxID=135626 RepID=UPI00200D5FDD|nr:EAL domain-containing protein [Shewanella olleyana]